MSRCRNGRNGWIAVGAVVTVWDAVAVLQRGETMSSAFRRAVAHPRRRWPTFAAVAYLLAHLLMPPRLHRYDPLGRLADLLAQLSAEGPAPPAA
jgi:hypothetical protein